MLKQKEKAPDRDSGIAQTEETRRAWKRHAWKSGESNLTVAKSDCVKNLSSS